MSVAGYELRVAGWILKNSKTNQQHGMRNS
jgi:hypothetical protein